MGMKKKAMFFTIIAILITSTIILSFSVSHKYRLKERAEIIQIRVESMNSFIRDMEDDMLNAVYITAFRSILSMGDYITAKGTFLEDTQQSFREAFLYGTINETFITLMEDSTFLNWTGRIQEQAEKLDITVNFNVSDVLIYHESPWLLGVSLNLTFNVTDNKKTASWVKSEFATATVKVEGFEDPIYTIYSFGRVFNIITKTNITDFVNESNNDTTNLQLHMDNSYYIASETGPSFLMRLEGNLSNSSNGIESLVNLEEFIMEDIAVFDKSVVDYIYFGNRSTTDSEMYFMPAWFRLDSDDNHINVYECHEIVK